MVNVTAAKSGGRPPVGGKPPKPGSRAAREALAAQQEAERVEAAARRRRQLAAGWFVGVLVLILVVLVVVKLTAGAGKAGPTAPAAASVVAQVTGVPASVFDTVGRGSVGTAPKATSGQDVLADNGKPIVFYMGAEFCPYCAAERWPLIIALSRFGTFTGLHTTSSAAGDAYPSTPTFSLYGTTYTSQYVELQSKEIMSDANVKLETLTPAQQDIVTALDPPDKGESGNPFPFISFGNQAVVVGSSYDPASLHGLTQAKVAATLSNPKSSLTKQIIGTANAFTAQICSLTQDQPSSVCSTKGAKAYSGS
jgi:thiol-disulfide isomerase/thioredoxin